MFTLAIAIGMAAAVSAATVVAQDPPAHEVVRLWKGDAPGAQGTTPDDVPTVTVYRPAPDKSNGASVVICPGGGYGMLAPHEGEPVALWLNTLGVTGVVLKYRLAPRYHHPAMMNDVNRAIRLVRAEASLWKLDPERIGVMGFSAGGHLAATAATHFDNGTASSTDTVERVSSRPNFAILMYAVITMTRPVAHEGTRENLLGTNPTDDLVKLMSNETEVTAQTPPTFLVQTADDDVVPMENSILFAQACRRAHVPAELHIFEHGAHGYGMAQWDEALKVWPSLCATWLGKHGVLTKKQ